MTYTAHDPRLLYDAIVTRLGSETGRPIGDGGAPSDTTTPYAVVYPLVDEPSEGPLNDPTQVVDDAFQVTCVGDNRASVQILQKNVRAALLGWTPTVTGFGTFPIQPLTGSGVTRDDDVQPPLFITTDRFTARLSG